MSRLLNTGLITTLIGIVILFACMYMWMNEKATQTEALSMAGLGLMFLRSKDSLIGLKAKEDGSDSGKVSDNK
jgi:UPF0716 family protein affecting phage T7 exclusion